MPAISGKRSIRAHMDKGHKMEAEHEFTLILDGISELTPEIFDALFEAGCDDATMSSRDGVVSLDFGRAPPP